MSEYTLLLVAGYVALTALVAAALIRARLHLVLKLAMVVAAGGLYFLSYQGWQAVQGWPAKVALPERFLLHASVIDEPDKTTGSPGAIYIWASDLAGGHPAAAPRAYRLPYDKKLHASLDDALRRQRNGVVQLGRARAVAQRPGVPQDSTRFGEKREHIEIYSLPDPVLPEK